MPPRAPAPREPLLRAIQHAAHVLLRARRFVLQLLQVLRLSPKPSWRILPPRHRDFGVFLVVFDVQRRPVLLAEIKDDAWTTKSDLRFKADEQMRQRYDSMLAACRLPRLWGLSLLGTSLRVYCGDVATEEVDPAFEDRPCPGRTFPRNFLEGAWDIDILSQEGFAKMKEIVGDIVRKAGAL